MFRGQLYAGKLFFGKLFGPEEEVTPQPELVLEYHGSGGRRHEHEERDLVERVLDKWRVIEAKRAEKAAKSVRKVEIDLSPSASDLDLTSEKDPQISDTPDPRGRDFVEVKQAPAITSGSATKSAIPPVIQTMFEPRVLDRVAPTRSTPDTVIVVPEDDMDEVMTVLLALEEAGEI